MFTVGYVVKPGDDNEELRYSLRSVAECWPDAEVWVSGFTPSWVTGVRSVPVHQIPGQKHPNSLRNQQALLTHPDTPDTYWAMNDDMFVLKPCLINSGSGLSSPMLYDWGKVKDVLAGYGQDRLGTRYYASMRATQAMLHAHGYSDPVSYAAHVPYLVHKHTMRDVVQTWNRPGVWIQHATITGNIIGLDSTPLPYGDVKVTAVDEIPGWISGSDYVSTHDVSFRDGRIGAWIRDRFPDRCKYENTPSDRFSGVETLSPVS